MALNIPNLLLGNRRNSTIIDPSSLDDWEPFKDMDSSSVATMLELSRHLKNSAMPIATYAHVDWKETSEGHVFMVEVPGLKKEEVKVEIDLDNKLLQIFGEKKVDKEENNDHRWHYVERSSGKFSRRFRLPDNVNINHVKASMENGLLTVTVPKLETKKPEIISVHISG